MTASRADVTPVGYTIHNLALDLPQPQGQPLLQWQIWNLRWTKIKSESTILQIAIWLTTRNLCWAREFRDARQYHKQILKSEKISWKLIFAYYCTQPSVQNFLKSRNFLKTGISVFTLTVFEIINLMVCWGMGVCESEHAN